MPRLAVTSLYCEEQNEPSKPDAQLILVPDDPAERDKMLAELYAESFDHGEEEEITVTETAEYGDLQVSSGTNDVHLFVTFVKLPGEDDELKIVASLTSEAFYDADDIPMVDGDRCRYWGAFEDSPVPNYRVWVLFNREPKSEEEAETLVRAYFGE